MEGMEKMILSTYAHVADGVVNNMSQATAEVAASRPGYVLVPRGVPVTMGWLFDGGQFLPPPAPPVSVPPAITPLQARRVLLAVGLLDDVETMIAQAPREARLAWEYAVEIYRNDPTLAMLATSLGLTSDQIDDLFRSAVEIV
jgi:hypothetical protein